MGVQYCNTCRAFRPSGHVCAKRRGRSTGPRGPTTLPGAIFQGVMAGLMAGFPVGQLTNSAAAFLAVALPVLLLRVGYHVAKTASPKARKVMGFVAAALAGVGAVALLGVWWSHRPQSPTKEQKLWLAAGSGDLEEVRRQLDRGAQPGGPDAPIVLAARSGSVEVVRLLLDRGASPDQKTWDGSTALHEAVTNRRPKVRELLLERRARTDLTNANGQTPLELAAREDDPAPVRALLAAGAPPCDWRALYVARPANLLLLLDACPKPDAVSADGKSSLLQLAARRGSVPGVELLLAKGAALDQAPPAGRRPLLEAVSQKHAAVAELLLARGASADPTSDGAAPLEAAVEAGLPELVGLLLKKGANVALCPKLAGASAEKLVELAAQKAQVQAPAR